MENDIKLKEENNKKKMILLILGALTVVIALIGATFAYFTAAINNVNGPQSVTLTTTTVQGLNYIAQEPLALVNILPGSSAETSFTIDNPNASATVRYSMNLVTDYNDFETTDGVGQLMLTISGGKLETTKILDLTDGRDTSDRPIVVEVPLAAGEVDTYHVKIEFVELGVLQNTNRSKNYVGHFDVIQSITTPNGY